MRDVLDTHGLSPVSVGRRLTWRVLWLLARTNSVGPRVPASFGLGRFRVMHKDCNTCDERVGDMRESRICWFH